MLSAGFEALVQQSNRPKGRCLTPSNFIIAAIPIKREEDGLQAPGFFGENSADPCTSKIEDMCKRIQLSGAFGHVES